MLCPGTGPTAKGLGMAQPPQEHGPGAPSPDEDGSEARRPAGQPLDSTAKMPATEIPGAESAGPAADRAGTELPPAGLPGPEAAPATEASAPTAGEASPPPQKWAARASVPTSRDAEEADWDLAGPPGRGVLVPVLLGILILLLLTLGAYGIWLGLRGPSEPPGPTPTTPVGPTTASTTPARPPTTPPTTPPAEVTLEDYRGRPANEVIGALTGLGLAPQRLDEASAEVPEGRVIRTEPGPGAKVPPGGAVKVFVSTGPPPETTPPPTTPPATP